MISVTPIYAGLVALLMAALSTRVALMRGAHDVALGDGGVGPLFLAQRRFGNLAEYAAAALLVLLLLELKGVGAGWLHLYGVLLVSARVLHPIMLFDRMSAPMWQKIGRFLAAATTASLLGFGGLALLLI